MPANIGQTAMARPSPPLWAVCIEAAVLKDSSGSAMARHTGGT